MPNPDLYSILGVDKSSDKKSMKKAYRKRAKILHPDHGGTVEKFGALKRAFDILTDDTRRKKYDATGDIDEKVPDNAYSNAINVLGAAFNAVLQECAQSGESPLERDIIALVKSKVANNINEAQKQIRIIKNMLDIDKKMVGRFKVKKGNNIFEAIVAQRITSLQINLKNCEDVIVNSNAAIELIKLASFKSDPSSRTSTAVGWAFVSMGSW